MWKIQHLKLTLIHFVLDNWAQTVNLNCLHFTTVLRFQSSREAPDGQVVRKLCYSAEGRRFKSWFGKLATGRLCQLSSKWIHVLNLGKIRQ